MTGRKSEEPGAPPPGRSTGRLDRAVQRRAHQLCRGAEPHAQEIPCPAHVQEARRQLVGLPV